MDNVVIFDTTLRDGEQSPGISLDVGEKLEIAEQLARLGVDVIEAGFPIASDGDFDSVEAISKGVQRSDHQRAVAHRFPRRRPGVGGGAPRRAAAHPRLHRDVADPHAEEAADDRDQVKAEVAASVGRARATLDDVEFSPEDGNRSDVDFMCEVCQHRSRQRRDHPEHPRHRRFRGPGGLRAAHRLLIEHVKGDYVVSTHCHNDLGPGRGELAGRRHERSAPDRVRDQRPRRARRQRRAGRGRDGDRDARRLLRRSRHRPSTPRSWPARRGSCRASLATRCSTTRRSSAATRSRTRPASTSTAC